VSWPAAPERPVPPLSAEAPPQRRLAGGAKWAWRLQQAGIWLAIAAIGTPIAGAMGVSRLLVPGLPLVLLVAAVLTLPPLRYSRWRWELRPEAIDIQHGTFTVRRTLVPLTRVQHVDTRRGVLEQMLDLATVVVHTAAGSHTIPYLAPADAAELRDRIAALARTDA
jgi:uncharacterized protein